MATGDLVKFIKSLDGQKVLVWQDREGFAVHPNDERDCCESVSNATGRFVIRSFQLREIETRPDGILWGAI